MCALAPMEKATGNAGGVCKVGLGVRRALSRKVEWKKQGSIPSVEGDQSSKGEHRPVGPRLGDSSTAWVLCLSFAFFHN